MKDVVLHENGLELEIKLFLNFWRYVFFCFNILLLAANTTPIFEYCRYNIGVVQTLQTGREL